MQQFGVLIVCSRPLKTEINLTMTCSFQNSTTFMFLSLQQNKLYNDCVVVFSLVDRLIRALVDFHF